MGEYGSGNKFDEIIFIIFVCFFTYCFTRLLPRFFHVIPDNLRDFVMIFRYDLDWQQYRSNVTSYFLNLIEN